MNDIACANQLMTDEINDVVYLISGGELLLYNTN